MTRLIDQPETRNTDANPFADDGDEHAYSHAKRQPSGGLSVEPRAVYTFFRARLDRPFCGGLVT